MAGSFISQRQFASNPDNMIFSYAELAISSLAVVVTIASIYGIHPWRDGQAE